MTLQEIMSNKAGRTAYKLFVTRESWHDEENYITLSLASSEYYIQRNTFTAIDFLDAADLAADDWKIVE